MSCLGRYRYRKRKSYSQMTLKVIVLLVVVPIVLFVSPEAWLPEVLIPDFWSHRGLWIVLLEYQMAWFYIVIIAVFIVGVKMLYDAF